MNKNCFKNKNYFKRNYFNCAHISLTMLIPTLHSFAARTHHKFEEVDVVSLVGLAQVLYRLDLERFSDESACLV